jgi:hypothetical protein
MSSSRVVLSQDAIIGLQFGLIAGIYLQAVSLVPCEIGGLENSLDKSSGFGYRRVG